MAEMCALQFPGPPGIAIDCKLKVTWDWDRMLVEGLFPVDTRETLFKLKIPLSSKAEQQKIADCLSVLYALITVQTEQIATLKEHKKA